MERSQVSSLESVVGVRVGRGRVRVEIVCRWAVISVLNSGSGFGERV